MKTLGKIIEFCRPIMASTLTSVGIAELMRLAAEANERNEELKREIIDRERLLSALDSRAKGLRAEIANLCKGLAETESMAVYTDIRQYPETPSGGFVDDDMKADDDMSVADVADEVAIMADPRP